MRIDGRGPRELRTTRITPGYLKFPAGSCLIEAGDTKVICSASVEDKIPPFLKGTSSGWLTAEYSMLPGSTETRTPREATRGKLGGRTVEIQRLIGRSLRAAVDLTAIGERTIWIDCDVIQADGGTRTASITGGFVALVLALESLAKKEDWRALPVMDYVAAVSVGVVQGEPVLDLRYTEDSTAEVDMNVVMTGSWEFIEVQGTAEHAPFSKNRLAELLSVAEGGVRSLMELQRQALGEMAARAEAYSKAHKSTSQSSTPPFSS